MTSKQRAPDGLGPEGKRLWSKLTEVASFSAEELMILEQCARQASDIATLEAAVAAGETKLISELRQARIALVRLLGALQIPRDDARGPMSPKSRQASNASIARWDRERAKRGDHG